METTATALALTPGRWELDRNHSSIGFTIRHLGVSKVRGRFLDFDADVVVGETLSTTQVTATVQLASVDTGNADRDAHVRAPDMVDVAARPTMTFRSERIVERGDGWLVDGVLSIGDASRPLELFVELGGVEAAPDGRIHAGFEARGELRRSDFGIAPGVPGALLSDTIKIEIDAQLMAP